MKRKVPENTQGPEEYTRKSK